MSGCWKQSADEDEDNDDGGAYLEVGAEGYIHRGQVWGAVRS